MDILLLEIDQCMAKSEETSGHIEQELSKLLEEIRRTKAAIEEEETPWEQQVEQLGTLVGSRTIMPKITKEHRAYFSAYSKFGKKIAANFPDDFDMAAASDSPSIFGNQGSGLRDGGPSASPMVAFIGQHMLTSGLSDILDTFTSESEQKFSKVGTAPPPIQDYYVDLRVVLQSLELHNPEPALQWFKNRSLHTQSNDATRRLLLDLHVLKFTQTLEQDGVVRALMYGREHFQPFLKDYRQEVAALFGAASLPSDAEQYKRMFNDRWAQVIEKVQKAYCDTHDAAASDAASTAPVLECISLEPLMPPLELVIATARTEIQLADEPCPLPPFPLVLDAVRTLRSNQVLRSVRRTTLAFTPPDRDRRRPSPYLSPNRGTASYPVMQAWSERPPRATRILAPSWTPDVIQPAPPNNDRRVVMVRARGSSSEDPGGSISPVHEVKREESQKKRQKVGIPRYSLLSVTLMAGYTALPKVLHYFNILHTVNPNSHAPPEATESVLNKKVLPVEIDLSASFAFHTSFTCAVTLTQTSRQNPPYLLQCGHIVSQACMDRLSASSRGRNFKCPICRQHQTTIRVRKLCL